MRRARRRSADSAAAPPRRAPRASSLLVLRRERTSSARRCSVTSAENEFGRRHAACRSATQLAVKPGPSAVSSERDGSPLRNGAQARTAPSATTCCRSRRAPARSWSSVPWSSASARLQRRDHLGAAGMADEAIDVGGRRAACRARIAPWRRPQIGGDEIRDGAAEDDAKPFGIDVPAHDAERIRPQVLAGILDPGRAAVAGAQHGSGGAVAEQGDGDDVGLGQFVEPEAPASRARSSPAARCCPALPGRAARRSTGPMTPPAQPRPNTGTRVTSDAEAHPARDARLQARRGDARRADGHDGVDIAGREVRRGERLLGGVGEQRLGALEKGLRCAPASRVARDTSRTA